MRNCGTLKLLKVSCARLTLTPWWLSLSGSCVFTWGDAASPSSPMAPQTRLASSGNVRSLLGSSLQPPIFSKGTIKVEQYMKLKWITKNLWQDPAYLHIDIYWYCHCVYHIILSFSCQNGIQPVWNLPWSRRATRHDNTLSLFWVYWFSTMEVVSGPLLWVQSKKYAARWLKGDKAK